MLSLDVPRRGTPTPVRLALPALLALLASCNLGTEPRARGAYSAVITGAHGASPTGFADFAADANSWVVSLAPRVVSNEFWHAEIAQRGPRPAVGATLTIGPGDVEGEPPVTHVVVVIARNFGGADASVWTAESGEVRITESTSGRLAGTFTFHAVPFPSGGTETVDVTGSFTALCALRNGC